MQRILIILTAMLAAVNIQALNHNSAKAGSIASGIDAPAEVSSLSISGHIDVRDLYFIASQMPALRNLNLSDAEIDAYQGVVDGLDAQNFVAGEIPAAIFADAPFESITFSKLQPTVIGNMAFCGSKLKSLNLGSNVTAVGEGAFCACNSLVTLDAGTLKIIGRHAFADCESLVSVTFNGVEKIESSAFARCRLLSDVFGSESLVVIGDGAFAGCESLTTFVFGPSLNAVGKESFAASGLTSIDMSQCVALCQIGDFAFANCDKLSEIILPETLTTLDRGAFFGDSALTHLQLPDALKDINDYALKGLGEIENLNLPADLSHVGTLAMSGMNNLKELTAVDIAVVPALGDEVWDRIDKSKVQLIVPDELADDFRATPQWQDFDIIENSVTSAKEGPIMDDIVVRGRFDGLTLEVEAQGVDLAKIDIFDTTGRLLLERSVNSSTASIDCSHLVDKLLIVLVTTTDGRCATIKLVKNG